MNHHPIGGNNYPNALSVSEDSSYDVALWTPPLSNSHKANDDVLTTTEDDDDDAEIQPLLYRMYIACHVLRLGPEARFSALVLLHRYYAAITTTGSPNKDTRMVRTDDEESVVWKWVAAACLFLACKIEEEPRRLRDVINLAHMILSSHTTASSSRVSAVNAPPTNLRIHSHPPQLNEDYWNAKKKIIETEQIVLRWLAFDVSVIHPHRVVMWLLHHEHPPVQTNIQTVAFRRLNDALFSSRALRHPVLSLACAAIVLAMDEVQMIQRWPDQWWLSYQISNSTLESAKRDLEEATNALEQCSNNKGQR